MALDSTRSIEIVQFVPEDEIDELYYNSSYYIAPPEGDYAEEAFAVIREALASIMLCSGANDAAAAIS